MIEENAAIVLPKRFDVACRAPELRIAARAEMQNERWAVALDLIVEPGPVRSCQEGHLQDPILAPPIGSHFISRAEGSILKAMAGSVGFELSTMTERAGQL